MSAEVCVHTFSLLIKSCGDCSTIPYVPAMLRAFLCYFNFCMLSSALACMPCGLRKGAEACVLAPSSCWYNTSLSTAHSFPLLCHPQVKELTAADRAAEAKLAGE